MNPLIQAYLNRVGRIRVVHATPGRLRVAIGGVRQYPALAEKFAGLFCDRILKQPGVTAAELSVLTGNLLVRYDATKTCEAEVIAWLDSSWTSFTQFLGALGDIDSPDDPGVAAAVTRFLATL